MMGRRTRTPEQFSAWFWLNVERGQGDACWPWKLGAFDTGYGALRHNGRTASAHRMAFTLSGGRIPPGKCVCHRCNNRLCANPAHLYAGSPLDNYRDSVRAGTASYGVARGRANGLAKLTDAKVRKARKLLAKGSTCLDVARKFGVSENAIGFIKRGETWRHVT